MIVVIDTNIWRNHLFMRSPAGAALQVYLTQTGHKIGLPEVVELEVREHLKRDLITSKAEIAKAYDRLLAYFGAMKEISLPSDEKAVELADAFFETLGFSYTRMPMDEDIARASFLRLARKQPPNPKSQHFKDSVIWECCLRWLEKDDVILVSDDKGFRAPENGQPVLHPQLFDELGGRKNTLKLMTDLKPLLKAVAQPIRCTEEAFVRHIEDEFRETIRERLHLASMDITGKAIVDRDYFACETPNLVYITASLTYPCMRRGEDGDLPGVLEITGECGWNVLSNDFTHFQPDRITTRYTGADGEESVGNSVYVRGGGAVIGHRLINRTFRHHLSTEQATGVEK